MKTARSQGIRQKIKNETVAENCTWSPMASPQPSRTECRIFSTHFDRSAYQDDEDSDKNDHEGIISVK